MRRWVLLGCGCLSTGCSFLFVRPPPSEHPQLAYFDCSSNYAAPATDSTMTVFTGLVALGASLDDTETSVDESEPGVARAFAAVALTSAAAAVYGFIFVSKCDSAKDDLALRVSKTKDERDALLHAREQQRAEPAGCRSDLDCKGERLCVSALCVEPPHAPASSSPAAPASASEPAIDPAIHPPTAVSPAGAPPVSGPPAAAFPPPAPAR